MLNQFVAFAVNNLFLVVAGGLVAVYLAYKFWQKVDSMVRSIQDWQQLVFVAVKYIAVVALLFGLGRWIYGTLNSAVIAAVNSGSVQTTGQAVVDIAGAVDQLVGWDGSAGLGSGMLTTSDLSNAIQMVQPALQTTMQEVAPSLSTDTLQSVIIDTAKVETAPAVAPASAPVTVGTGATSTLIVMPGDSLAAIAKRVYGDADLWPVLCKANQALVKRNCNALSAGMNLVIPPQNYAATTDTSAVMATVKAAAPTFNVATAPVYGPVEQKYAPTAVPAGGAWATTSYGLPVIVTK